MSQTSVADEDAEPELVTAATDILTLWTSDQWLRLFNSAPLSLTHKQVKWLVVTEVQSESFGHGYRAPSLQCTSYLCMLLLCEASSVFHRRVWYRALSPCYACNGRSGIILTHRLPLCQILFLSPPPPRNAELASAEKSDTQSLTQLIWSAGNRSLSLRNTVTLLQPWMKTINRCACEQVS